MLTDAERTALQAVITKAETELAALQQQRRDTIQQARSINRKTTEIGDQITAIETSDALKAARDTLAADNAASLKAKAEAARKEAEAKATARAEVERQAAEAKAKEASDLAAKDAEIAALKEQLAAKG